jgi:hypothetical protein
MWKYGPIGSAGEREEGRNSLTPCWSRIMICASLCALSSQVAVLARSWDRVENSCSPSGRDGGPQVLQEVGAWRNDMNTGGLFRGTL